MVAATRRLSLLVDVIDVVLLRLSRVSPSGDAEKLRAEAGRCLVQAHAWNEISPSTQEYDAMTRRLLELHRAVDELQRRSDQISGGPDDGA